MTNSCHEGLYAFEPDSTIYSLSYAATFSENGLHQIPADSEKS